MLTYNTQQPTLTIPEYGRNIQRMVDHCLTLEDRDERTRCAYTIVGAMGALFPELQQTEAGRHKLWDHLAVMAGNMDIDWPVEVTSPENRSTRPEKIPYPTSRIKLRHYGRAIEASAAKLAAMEPGDEREALADLLANQMKKLLAAQGIEIAEVDRRVFKDLADYTHGEIRLDLEEGRRLHEYEIVAPPTGKKKRKKK